VALSGKSRHRNNFVSRLEPSPPSAVCREAASLGHGGITVNVVAPGFFATESNAKEIADPSVVSWINHRTALGRWGDPREIAGVVAFLASDAASYITRQVLFGYPHRLGAAGAQGRGSVDDLLAPGEF
jgi:NAD(P)-dependent dehydrogenase (short-subunit alcohol dehydrogenase family)